MTAFLDGGMKQEKPSKQFLKDTREALLYIHAISYSAGRYWVNLKAEIDAETIKQIKNSKSMSEKTYDISQTDLADFTSNMLFYADIPKKGFFAKIKPTAALRWLSEKLGEKTAAYLKKIETAVSDKIEISAKLAFYDNSKHLRDFVKSNLRTGESLQQAIKRLKTPELLNKIGITDTNKYYLETVIRTNEVTAQSAGDRNESLENKAVEFYQYIAILDPRTTDVCKSLDQIVKKKTDEIWETYLPPNHFNCRSRVITLSKELAEILGIKESSKTDFLPSAENFDVNPAKTWSMPTKDMRRRLADHLGVDYKEIPKGARFEP